MDPVSATAVGMAGMGASGAGAGLGAAGALMQGDSQSKMYKYQAGVAKLNAAISRQNAEWSIRSGESEALQSGRKTGQIIGAQKTQQAANNMDVNFGSAQQVRDSQRMIGQEELGNIRTNANRMAYGHLTEAASQDATAKADLAAAKTSRTASYINAGSSILGGVSSVSSKWLQGQQIGLWGGQPTKLGDATMIYGSGGSEHNSGFAYG